MAASRYRIESAGMKGVAFKHPAGNKHHAFQQTVAVKGFQGIFRTGGVKTAAGT
jgi:hypothetical protein